MTFYKGQRLQTKLGPGTVLGFEHWTKEGQEAKPISDIDTGGRVIVQLDHPENWRATELTPNPYMMRHELQELRECDG